MLLPRDPLIYSLHDSGTVTHDLEYYLFHVLFMTSKINKLRLQSLRPNGRMHIVQEVD